LNDYDGFDFVENEADLISEAATCEKYDFFEFIMTSSQMSGYGSLQTLFVKTRSKKNPYIRCSVYENECNCVPMNSKANPMPRENFLKSKKQ